MDNRGIVGVEKEHSLDNLFRDVDSSGPRDLFVGFVKQIEEGGLLYLIVTPSQNSLMM